jgi:tetratricopeptide (TPR) repeat protein
MTDRALRLGAILLCLAAACAGDTKKADTTPKAGSGSGDQSMQDADPKGAGNVAAGGGAAPGTPTPPGGPAAPPSVPGDPISSGPPIVIPNMDPDPGAAKQQVDSHLTIARAALAAATPDPDTALREAREALKADATNVDAAAMVAFAYYHKKLYDTAELVLDDLIKRDVAKNNANVMYVYGLIYDHTNRPEQALKAYTAAVAINPNFPSALVNLGVFQLKNKQYTEAQNTFERLTNQFNRQDAITLTSLGSAYRGRSGDLQAGDPNRDNLIRQAEATYKRAMMANPSYGPAYYNMGLLYLDADPFPGITDPLTRVNAAKDYFDKYKNMPGVDIKLFDERMKDVTKLIKRIQKQQKKGSSPPSGGAAPGQTPPKKGKGGG